MWVIQNLIAYGKVPKATSADPRNGPMWVIMPALRSKMKRVVFDSIQSASAISPYFIDEEGLGIW